VLVLTPAPPPPTHTQTHPTVLLPDPFSLVLGMLFQVEGVKVDSPMYQALTVILLALCALFVAFWGGCVVYEMWTRHRRRQMVIPGAPLMPFSASVTSWGRGESVKMFTPTLVPHKAPRNEEDEQKSPAQTLPSGLFLNGRPVRGNPAGAGVRPGGGGAGERVGTGVGPVPGADDVGAGVCSGGGSWRGCTEIAQTCGEPGEGDAVAAAFQATEVKPGQPAEPDSPAEGGGSGSPPSVAMLDGGWGTAGSAMGPIAPESTGPPQHKQASWAAGAVGEVEEAPVEVVRPPTPVASTADCVASAPAPLRPKPLCLLDTHGYAEGIPGMLPSFRKLALPPVQLLRPFGASAPPGTPLDAARESSTAPLMSPTSPSVVGVEQPPTLPVQPARASEVAGSPARGGTPLNGARESFAAPLLRATSLSAVDVDQPPTPLAVAADRLP
jgi:hypothetical protein